MTKVRIVWAVFCAATAVFVVFLLAQAYTEMHTPPPYASPWGPLSPGDTMPP